MNKTEFQTAISQTFSGVSDQTFDLIEKYKTFLQAYNEHTNLTNLASNELIYGSYFYESIMPFYYADIDCSKLWKVLDIGSGSGIPGVLLKIIYPHWEITLLDSNQKKCVFLAQLIDHLGLTGITVINDRAENFIKYKTEAYDLVTSRAVSELNKILELSAGFSRLGGYLIEPKSLKGPQELLNAQNAVEVLGLKLINDYEYDLNEKHHHCYVFEKLNKTPEKYPRKWNQILKDPL